MTSPTHLDSRYGRTPERKKRDKRTLWVAAAGFAVVLVAWVVWGGLDGDGPMLKALDTGYKIVDEHYIVVNWDLSVPAGNAVDCAVQALNEDHAIVGWKIVEIPASDVYTRPFNTLLRTTELSNTGLISECWLA